MFVGCYISFRMAVPRRGRGGEVRRYTNHPIIVIFGWYIVPHYFILVMRYMHMYLSVSIGEKNDLIIFGGRSYQRGKAALDPFLEYL